MSSPLLSGQASSSNMRVVPQTAYRVGEVLEYKIRYGFIEAGEAILRVSEQTRRADRPVYHIIGTGRSVGMAEWFFRTRDRYETFIDTEGLVPWEFIRDIDEGGYKKHRHLIFDQVQGKVYDRLHPEKGSFEILGYAQDMLSSLYFARSINPDDLKAGDYISFNMFLDYEEFPFRLKYLGKETIKTKWGKQECLVFRPSLQEGRVFKDEEDMTIWVSNDENKIPVLMQSNLLVGSIKVELKAVKGLRNKGTTIH